MSTPAPFDSDYTATNFVGFSISVDIVAGSNAGAIGNHCPWVR